MKEKIHHIYVIIIYTILTLIMTYPVAFKENYIPGIGDVYGHLWYFWWFKTAIMSGISPFFTQNMFYPNGVNLILSIEPGGAIFMMPLQLIFGLINGYKILFLLTFIISGYGTYLLVKYLTDGKMAAFISGLIFMFSPFHFAHALGHTNLMSIQWIPFYILFLIKIMKEDKISNVIYASIFLLMTSISSYYYAIYMLILTGMILLYYFLIDRKILRLKISKILLMVLIFGLLFSPFLYLILKENPLDNKSLYIGGYVEFSADLLGFFTPSMFHPILKDYAYSIYKNFTGNGAEWTVYAGYTVLFLALVAILKIKTREIKFWSLSAIIFGILSLGPILHINGIFNYNGILSGSYEGRSGLMLPYAILMKIPIFSIARVPSRWDVLVMLSLAILSGYGLNYIFKKYNGKKKALTVIFSALILFEFLNIPFIMSENKIPDFYYQLKNDTDNYAILELPIYGYSPSLYYQTIHEKKLVNGYVSRPPSYIYQFFDSTPVIQSLRFNNPEFRDILVQNNSEIGQSIFNYYNIRYVDIHTNNMSDPSNYIIQKMLNIKPGIYKEDDLIVYKINKSDIKPFIIIEDGWYGVENWKNLPGRWMNGNSTIKIISPRDINVTLFFDVESFYKDRNLYVYTNEKLVGEYIVELRGDTLKNISVPIILKKGENTVRFDSGKGVSPLDIGLSIDQRELSLGFQNITLVY